MKMEVRSKGRVEVEGSQLYLDDDACELAESLLLDPQYGNLVVVAAELYRRELIKVSTKTLSKAVKSFCKRMGRPYYQACLQETQEETYSSYKAEEGEVL